MIASPTKLAAIVLTQFLDDVRKGFTINELSRRTKKSYANIHKTVKSLLKEEILTREVIGHSHYCRLNLSNDTTLLYLALLQVDKKENLLKNNPSLKSVAKKLEEKEGVLFVWKRRTDVLAVVKDKDTLKTVKIIKAVTLEHFLDDKELISTIGTGTLLLGHTRYPDLLRRAFK